MLVDGNVSHYYQRFIEESKNDEKVYKKEYGLAYQSVKKIKEWLSKNQDFIHQSTNINLKKYKKEFILELYNSEKELYNKAIDKLKCFPDNTKERITILQIIKYCDYLEKKHVSTINLRNAKVRNELTFSDYRKIISNYYRTQVSKCILEGFVYKIGYKVGDLMINRWDIDYDVKKKKVVDWAATKKKKEEFIKQGKPLYDSNMAKLYKEKGLKYDVENYVVYKNNTCRYTIELYHCRYINNKGLEVKVINSIPRNLKHKTFEELASMCKTIDDIYNLDVSLNVKKSLLLLYDPTTWLLFQRDERCAKYLLGEYKSKILFRH